MPLKSKAQMRWMFANHPTMAKKWTKHTEDVKSLPEKTSTTPGVLLADYAMIPKKSTSAAGQSHTDGPQMSEKSASRTIDLDWLDGPERGSDRAHPPETCVTGLIEAARRVKLANTLTGVLKTAFGHRTSNVSCYVDLSSRLAEREVTGLYLGSGVIDMESGLTKAGMGGVSGLTRTVSELILQPAKSAGCDKSSTPTLTTCDQTGLDKTAIQIPPGWQPRPMIDIQKMILKPHPKLTTPLGASIKAHDTAQAEAAAKAKPGAQAGTGTSVGPGNSPNIHPITSFSGLGPAGTVNGNASFGTANSSTKSAAELPGAHPWSGNAVAEAMRAGLNPSSRSPDPQRRLDMQRAQHGSSVDLDSYVRRQARMGLTTPVTESYSPRPMPGAGQFAPGTRGSNGLLQPQPPAGPPGTDTSPVMPRPSPLIKPQIKLPTDTGPLTPTPGTGLPGTNALETPFAGIGGQLKVAQPSTRSAVLVTGNPKFIRDNPKAEAFYASLEKHLQGAGFRTSRDPGEPHTMPQPADLWIGHSRGAGRFEYAPATQKYLSFGSSRPGSINHPGDTAMQPGDTPTDEHYVVTPEMRTAIDQLISESGSQLKVADLLPGGLGDNKPDSDFDSSSLLQGTKHETEHTKRRPIAKEIAKDHLSEDPAYYRKLEQVEDPKLVDVPRLPAVGKLPRGPHIKSTRRTFAEAGQQWYRATEIARELAELGHASRTMPRAKFLEWLARPEGQLKAAATDEALGMKADSAGSSAPKLESGGLGNGIASMPTGTSMSPIHQLPVGSMRIGSKIAPQPRLPGSNAFQTMLGAAPGKKLNPATEREGLIFAARVMHGTDLRSNVTTHLTNNGYQPNGPAEKMLYERSLGGGAQPPMESDPSRSPRYVHTKVPLLRRMVYEKMNLPRPLLPPRVPANTTPDNYLAELGTHAQDATMDAQPHVTARHEAEHAKQTQTGVHRELGELGPSLGDIVHSISADRMTRGQDLSTAVQPSLADHLDGIVGNNLNLHQFARQARAGGWPQVSMTELLAQPGWVGKRRALSNYGNAAASNSVLDRGQDPNLKMPQPLLKSSSAKELWNHPARPFVTQAAVGAGTSLALNEVLRRAIEAYQGKPTDADTIHRERLMAAGMGAGMGLSREAMPHIADAAQPYVQSLIG